MHGAIDTSHCRAVRRWPAQKEKRTANNADRATTTSLLIFFAIGSDHTEWNLSRGMRMSSQKSPRTLEYADVATISAAKNGCDASDLLEKPRKELRFCHQLLTRSPCTKIRRAFALVCRYHTAYHASNSSYGSVSLWLHRHHEKAIGQSQIKTRPAHEGGAPRPPPGHGIIAN